MEVNHINYIEKAIFQGVNDFQLSDDIKEHIAKWKDKPGSLIMILHKVQEKYGYIPMDVAVKVAKEINIHLAKIYGVITFYHFFKTEKPAKHKISVCMGTACYLKGAETLFNELKQLTGIETGHASNDGLFSLETVRCIGCCGLAPVITIDGEVYGNLKKDDLPEILSKYTDNNLSKKGASNGN